MEKITQKQMTRREVLKTGIKAGGVLALGLAYSKPFIETVRARPAFDASYRPPDDGGTTED